LAGYDVKCTDSAEETIDLLTKERFGLCLLDSWLPGTSGVEICEKIRQLDAKYLSFSILAQACLLTRNAPSKLEPKVIS
jgi:DNA-binding response OmpR family regulator